MKFKLTKELYKKMLSKFIIKNNLLKSFLINCTLFLTLYSATIFFVIKDNLSNELLIIVMIAALIIILISLMIKYKIKINFEVEKRSILGEVHLITDNENLIINVLNEENEIIRSTKFKKDELYHIYEDKEFIFVLKDKKVLILAVPKKDLSKEEVNQLLNFKNNKKDIRKNNYIKIFLLALMSMLLFLLSMWVVNSNRINKEYPLNYKVGNYDVDILSSRYYEDYVLTTYKVKSLDNSQIENNDISLNLINNNDSTKLDVASSIIDEKRISNNEIEVTSMVLVQGDLEKTINISYSFSGEKINNLNENILNPNKEIILKRENKNFIKADKEFKLGIKQAKFNSLGIFPEGILVDFSMKDWNPINNYKIKVVTEDKEVNVNSKYQYDDKNTGEKVYIAFIPNSDDINLKSFKVYIVNNNDKQLLYQKK